MFTKSEIDEIRRVTLWDVITNTTTIDPSAIQRNVFVWSDGDPCPQPEQLKGSMLDSCVPLQRYDYFVGSELVYIYVCVFIAFIPILCAGAGYGVVKLQNRRRRRLKIVQESIKRRSGRTGCIIGNIGNGRIDKMIVREWLHANHKRLVKVKFGPEAALHIVDRKGDNLRTFDFSGVNVVAVEESQVILYKLLVRVVVVVKMMMVIIIIMIIGVVIVCSDEYIKRC